MDLDLLVASIATALLAATPVLIAATGELFAETVGVYNLGIEGSMLAGALAGLVATNESGNLLIGLTGAILVGAAVSLVFGAAVVILRADVVVAGLAMTFISVGLTGVFGRDYVRAVAVEDIPRWEVPLLADIPYLGDAAFKQLALVYLAFLAPIAAWVVLFRTRHGLNMRAIGESPSTADLSGISVIAWRLFYVTVGGAFAGLGGGFLSLGAIGSWLPGITAGEGWIALAIVIFAGWRPIPLIFGAFLFGALGTLGNVAQALGWSVPSEFFSALPYLGTLVVVAVLAWIRVRSAGPPPWPAALGQPFFRGAE